MSKAFRGPKQIPFWV